MPRRSQLAICQYRGCRTSGGLKKIGKYLAGRPRLVAHFPWQTATPMVTGYTDSDWAGCSVTAKSTSGGIICIGAHTIKSYSRQQKTIALSSAEAELHAMVAASAEVMGVIGLCSDLGMHMQGEILADSSAALGISNRSGIGKVRHLRIQALWVQEVRSTGRLGYKKVLGTLNPSDILTKHVPSELLDAHLKTLGMEVRGGRADAAPTLDAVDVEYIEDWYEPIKVRRVSFRSTVTVRPIPAAGRGRPTCQAGKVRKLWADTDDGERGIDSIQSEGEMLNDVDEWQIMDEVNYIDGSKQGEGNMDSVLKSDSFLNRNIVPRSDICTTLNITNSRNMIESLLTRTARRRPWVATQARARRQWSCRRIARADGVCSFRERKLRFVILGDGGNDNIPIVRVERTRSEFARRGSAGYRDSRWRSSRSCSSGVVSGVRIRALPPSLRPGCSQTITLRPAQLPKYLRR